MQVCLDPKYARYINLASELQAYLAERYGKGLDFGVKHQNDRWYFTLPGNQEMTEKQLKDMTNNIVDKREAAQRAAKNA